MKNLILLFVLSTVLSSCSTDADEISLNKEDIYGKWNLVKMTGSFGNSLTTGEDMEWQESYNFNRDGTFIKSRSRDGELTEAAGTFVITENDSQFNDPLINFSIEIEFSNSNSIAASCYSGGMKEELYFRGDRMLSNYHACDGPGLEYKKSK
ncbi:hypothetical protein FK178_07910 [Antarcticibacterium arcticum]|uniref:Lipocalin-like domain-containing protein n=1 Tax=Antarcticibacterium arcticum TaxID=2585771 RepID=A0A5B8YN27_9FLAO|nr:hypothetical protein [Antarcticibacterium arcticum]QED37656.1 hypothetical protein FK178_07910 [Antarcticibacterium arcticum]